MGAVLLGLLVCLAAWSSGTSTFLLMGSLLFSIVALSVIEGNRLIAGIEVSPPSGGGIFARRATGLSLRLASRRGPMAVFLSHPSLVGGVGGVALPGGGEALATIRPERRGRLRLEGIRARTVAPYGLTVARRAVSLATPLLVYPEPAEGFSLQERLPRHVHGAGGGMVVGGGSEIHSLRDYRPEDGVRRIHWKAVARTGQLLSRVDEEEDRRALVLHLERRIPEDTPAWREGFERAVSQATAAVLQAHEHDLAFRLVVAGMRTMAGRGRRHRDAALALLAEVEPLVGTVPARREGAIHFGAVEEGPP